MKRPEHVIIPVTLLMVIVIVAYARYQTPERTRAVPRFQVESTIPDFASYNNVTRKKNDFFEYLLPMVRNANARVIDHRQRLQRIAERLEAGERLSSRETEFVRELATRYKVKLEGQIEPADLDELLIKVDFVPASLILAQAANESAWGTSRFAKQAFNFFGIWCFSPGCGVTPRYRDEGLTHEVRSFDSVQDGVHYYLQTINSNRAYTDLREIRASLRAQNQPITGSRLAEGLLRYSERGQEYVDEIQAMIRINDLREYNLATTEQPPDRG